MAREIKETVVKVLSENEFDPKNKNILRIVRWNNGRPQLEKRKFYKVEDGWKPGKASGMNAEDFAVIKENLAEIEKLINEK